ncbi:hypothetical protein HOA92_00625 [archaeon]|jgi:hypothetical protein|nr:hypothetical protein [archaeon]MBT6761521.1 hypothetical protein [archaeon]
MPPPLIFGIPARLTHLIVELLYFILILGFCLATYFKTKEIEELTNHQGISLFRKIFLFFSFAFLVRMIHMGFILYLGKSQLRAIPGLQRLVLLVVSIFSTIALLYLLATMLIKHLKKFKLTQEKIFVFFVVASIVLMIPTIYFRTQTVLIAAQLALILAAGVHIMTSKHKAENKRKSSFFSPKLLYLLISVFWILNLLVSQRIIIHFESKILIYLASISIFAIIYHRVHQRLEGK